MASADPNRSFMKDVKRIIIKVGTAVITRNDGRLALGRIGALCEQVKDLNAQGYEVIMVTSGAVGVGRQRLRYRKLVNSSFADLQKPQMELDGKACEIPPLQTDAAENQKICHPVQQIGDVNSHRGEKGGVDLCSFKDEKKGKQLCR